MTERLKQFAASVQALAPQHYTAVGFEIDTFPISGTQTEQFNAYAKGIAATGRTPEEATERLRLKLERYEMDMATFNKPEGICST